MLPFQARVDLGARVMKGCSAFSKAPASLEPHHQIVNSGHSLDGSYPFAETQSVYSTAPADWAINICSFSVIFFKLYIFN